MKADRYYVYSWVDPVTNIPFYIGKGTDKRATNFHQSGRCENKRQKLLKEGYTIEQIVYIVQDSLTEVQALKLENELINKYKRIEDGGTLFNYKIGNQKGNKIIDPVVISDIIDMYCNDRQTAYSIGKRYNLHESTVLRYLRLSGIKPRPRGSRFNFTADELKRMKDLRISGKSYRYIANEYKCSVPTIKSYIDF